MYSNALVQTIVDFITSIGLGIKAAPLTDATFLPGIAVHGGGLRVDETRLLYPGDLLHEAGHLALMTREQRAQAHDAVEHEDDLAWEAATIAWSYAAALHLQIDPTVVFHSGGYKGGSAALLNMFALGIYPGASTLAALGLTHVEVGAALRYPAMVCWVRPERA